jgi:carbon storage regulator CsrA
MLVLTRKADEQILIGEDIKITLVRVRGNSVRLGIDAPRDVRIVRGELDLLVSDPESDVEVEINDRDQVFAHPQPEQKAATYDRVPSNRLTQLMDQPDAEPVSPTTRSIFVGRIHRPESSDRTKNAPLSGFMTSR